MVGVVFNLWSSAFGSPQYSSLGSAAVLTHNKRQYVTSYNYKCACFVISIFMLFVIWNNNFNFGCDDTRCKNKDSKTIRKRAAISKKCSSKVRDPQKMTTIDLADWIFCIYHVEVIKNSFYSRKFGFNKWFRVPC